MKSDYTFQGKSISEHLLEMASAGNKQFAAMLNPGVDAVLGIRVPSLRLLAKAIAQSDTWRQYLASADTEYMESRMLHGMVIGYVKGITAAERLALVKEWVPRVNSWSVCDSACSTFKPKKSEREQWWQFIQPYFKAKGEYEVRFAVVMAMDLFIDEEHITEILRIADGIRHEGYYVKMAVAWLISVCYVKLPGITMPYLQHNHLDDFTHNKALQKICESLRATSEQKAAVRLLKRKEVKR
ncbi:MAG: DNA alkylation repair protein [Bacteroidales bacterium]|nr:DNA alkylation repair protein [Bacteroidales bacterium]